MPKGLSTEETPRVTVGLRSTEEVAAFLGVPVGTMYRWRVNGGGPRAIRVGKHLRWRDSDVDAWLDEHADPTVARRRRRATHP